MLFTGGDRSFKAADALRLLEAIAAGADLAIGSWTLGQMEPGALSAAQLLGNRLAGFLSKRLWRREAASK